MPASPAISTVAARPPATVSNVDARRSSSSRRPTNCRLDTPWATAPGSSVADNYVQPMYGEGLCTFCNGGDGVGDQSVGGAVDGLGGRGVRRLDEAEHLARALVEPVLQVTDAVALLLLEIALVGLGDSFGGQAVDVVVDIHEQGHGFLPSLLVSRVG